MMKRRIVGAGIAGMVMLAGVACAPPSPTAVRITPESELDHQQALISADGSTVVSKVAGRPELAVIDVATKGYELIAIGEYWSIESITPDGAYAMTLRISNDPVGLIPGRVDLATGEIVDTGAAVLTFEAQMSDDGMTVARPTYDCTGGPTCTNYVKVWRDGSEQTYPFSGAPLDQLLTPDGSRYLVLSSTYPYDAANQSLLSIDTTTGAVTTLDIERPTVGLTYLDGASVTGDEIRVTATDGSAWSIGTGHAPQTRRACGSSFGSNPYTYGRPSADGAYCVEMVSKSNGDTSLQVVDSATGAVRQVVSTDSGLVTPKLSARPSVSNGGRTVYGYRLANENGAALYIDG